LTEALTSSGTLTNVQVSECADYNDQATLLATSPPRSTFSGLTYGYYGPVVFYAAGEGIETEINGRPTGLGAGGFTLAPGESASFGVTLPTQFLMFGR
jgi:hypothetical protein